MPNDGFLIELALVAVLIGVNGFFAGAEIAVVSARSARVQPLAEQGDARARALLALKADPDRFLATVQIGVTLVSTLASAVGGVAAIERLEPMVAALPVPWARAVAEPAAVGLVVFVIAYLSLVVGELVPKSLAVRHAEAVALRVARPILALRRMSGPAVAVLTASSGLFLRLFLRQNLGTHRPFHTLDDLRVLAQEAEAQGLVHGDVVSGAVEFQDRDVREVMTPRNRVVGIPLASTVHEAVRRVGESGHSRFPAYRQSLDDVPGFVYARDLYDAERRGASVPIESLLRPALIVPWNKRATALLADMRTGRVHMALVVDEHGSTIGLVTLEDLIEVIVGEIHDEHGDAEAPRMTTTGEGSYEAEGGVPVRELNEELSLRLPESPDYITVAGLVLERLGAVPRGGETVRAGGYDLSVLAMDGHRVARVRIDVVAGPPPGGD
jgi:putative hemolysin